MEGRSQRKRICVYVQLIHFVVPQKLTQYCKAIIRQVKNKNKKLFLSLQLPEAPSDFSVICCENLVELPQVKHKTVLPFSS